jgi:hypothetical protein
MMAVTTMKNRAVRRLGNRDIKEAIMTLELLVYSWGLPNDVQRDTMFVLMKILQI